MSTEMKIMGIVAALCLIALVTFSVIYYQKQSIFYDACLNAGGLVIDAPIKNGVSVCAKIEILKLKVNND